MNLILAVSKNIKKIHILINKNYFSQTNHLQVIMKNYRKLWFLIVNINLNSNKIVYKHMMIFLIIQTLSKISFKLLVLNLTLVITFQTLFRVKLINKKMIIKEEMIYNNQYHSKKSIQVNQMMESKIYQIFKIK